MATNTDSVLVADVIVGKRFRKDLGDVNAFAANIDEVGLLQPIVISPTNELICGQRRLEAAKQLGWEEIPARVLDVGSLLLGEWSENEYRKELTPSEKVEIGKAVEDWLEDRHGSNGHINKTPEKPEVINGAKIAPPQNGQKTREIAAQASGFGNQETYRQAKKVVAKGVPELVQAMDSGDVSISDAATVANSPPKVQRKAVAAVQAGKATTAAKVAAPRSRLDQIDELLGKAIRLADEEAGGKPNRYAEQFRTQHNILRKILIVWKKAS